MYSPEQREQEMNRLHQQTENDLEENQIVLFETSSDPLEFWVSIQIRFYKYFSVRFF